MTVESFLKELISSKSVTEKAAVIADNTLKGLEEETTAYIAQRCVILHWFDRRIVQKLLLKKKKLDKKDFDLSPAKIYEQLASLPFIHSIYPGRLAYHNTTREGLLNRYTEKNPESLKDAAKLAALVYSSYTTNPTILGEAFFCYAVAGKFEEAIKLMNDLLEIALLKQDPQVYKSTAQLQREAENLFPSNNWQLLTEAKEKRKYVIIWNDSEKSKIEIPINTVDKIGQGKNLLYLSRKEQYIDFAFQQLRGKFKIGDYKIYQAYSDGEINLLHDEGAFLEKNSQSKKFIVGRNKRLRDKKAIVSQLKFFLSESQLVLVIDYQGLSVAEITDLRQRLHSTGTICKITKNTLMRFAVASDDNWLPMMQFLKGSSAFFFIKDDMKAAINVYQKFQKETRKSELRGGVLEGTALTPDEIEAISELPSKEELMARIANLLKSIPTQVAISLDAVPTGLAVGIDDIPMSVVRAVKALSERNCQKG